MRRLKTIVLSAAIGAAMLAGTVSASAEEVLRLRLNGDINTLDPISTTNFTIRNAAYLMYDTLFALDSNYEVQPQMAEGYTLSDDGRVYTITLRDGLMFHDGSPVTGADVVASIQRWGKVDGLGKILFSKLQSIEAPDDKTVVLTMNEPWGQVIPALGKISSNVPVIMPASQAANDPSEAVANPIGSGPYKLLPDEWVPGSIAVFEKFGDYVPRDEPADMAAGGKVAHFDRVELVYIPDTATAIDALIAGEIDWIEEVPADMLAFFEGADSAKPIAARQSGNSMQLVVNHLNPPFDDPKIRHALQWAVEQKPFLQAAYGNATDRYLECAAVFFCDTPYATDANTERVLNRDVDKAKALLEEAGYDGTPVVLMHVTDIPAHDAYYSVLKPMLEEAGFVVDDQPSDWATVATRRASKEPVADGGWNLFFTGWGFVDQSNPMTNVYVAGDCDNGWFGWACSEELQELRKQFAEAEDPEVKKALAEKMQILTHDLVSYVPLGQSFPSQGIATNLEGFIESPVPFFWEVQRTQ
ncbi:ABC transporter substrate-binding protein [Hoeflea sp. WL0058]|uniref:ABC transporter substrate-binding protein n=1 Tax=Flavimaribacter sediminis TaxID=2865987 RepID=A0AAE3D222_9HYPH|nr:ABC transporter substrate-binding protein [Flavimaribacter sediminis]MBW8639519.1 ABC transporter substrate-binding protein [Flavimaribacter sediminis]